ncbi:GNAT family N-acetyltransferase [Metabacillus bambusae]|nr:GNAT family N-acetyltransferase [Metabacillus bambusae]
MQEPAPFELLLEADPSLEKVEANLKTGTTFIAENNHEIIGIIIVVPLGEIVDEIVNLAVRKDFRGNGIAKQLIEFAVENSKDKGKIEMLVGTGNSSLDQLALYQKCGFRIFAIKKDYFIDNYNEVIIENGIRCMDMIMLKKE